MRYKNKKIFSTLKQDQIEQNLKKINWFILIFLIIVILLIFFYLYFLSLQNKSLEIKDAILIDFGPYYIDNQKKCMAAVKFSIKGEEYSAAVPLNEVEIKLSGNNNLYFKAETVNLLTQTFWRHLIIFVTGEESKEKWENYLISIKRECLQALEN